jgi:hypothetical protein
MADVHKFIGFVIVVGWGVLLLWGLVTFLVKREPNQWFWRLIAVLQVVLIVQILAGLTLLAIGRKLPSMLHLFYGSVFPATVLIVAHVVARGMDEEKATGKVFALASFFVFGLTLRALTTGLGMP